MYRGCLALLQIHLAKMLGPISGKRNLYEIDFSQPSNNCERVCWNCCKFTQRKCLDLYSKKKKIKMERSNYTSLTLDCWNLSVIHPAEIPGDIFEKGFDIP